MSESIFEVVVTRSGQAAMLDRKSGEIMHPVGPAREAAELYVGPSQLSERLLENEASPLVVYDVGLGAGSNAATAWRSSEARTTGRPLDLISFDRTTAALIAALAHPEPGDFGFDASAELAAQGLLRSGEHRTPLTRWRLSLGKLPGSLADCPKADVVFWDPFSPKTNPGLWSVPTFERLRAACAPRATVHTYSASTRVRAALLLAGFAVGEGPATGGKARTTVAACRLTDLRCPLGRRWLERLRRSSAEAPEGAAPGALEQICGLRQFNETPVAPQVAK